MAYRRYRRRTYIRKRPIRVTIRKPLWKRKRQNTKNQLRKDVYFTRLFYSENVRFSGVDTNQIFSTVDGVDITRSSNWKRMINMWQYVKVHKVVIKFTPCFNMTQPGTSEIGPHAAAPFFLSNGSNTVIKPDSELRYNDIMGLPMAKSGRATKELTISFRPCTYSVGRREDTATQGDEHMTPNYTWINTDSATIPLFQGYAYGHAREFNNNVRFDVTVQKFIYCSFKGTKRTMTEY